MTSYNQIKNQLEPIHVKVCEWAEARNLIKGATPQAQFTKLVEELSEFTTGWGAGDQPEIKDGLGDSMVVLTVLAAQLNTSVAECTTYLETEQPDMAVPMFEGETIANAYLRGLINQVGMLATGISKKNVPMQKLGIGGSIILLHLIIAEFGLETVDTFQAAYDVIKDRKGKMVDGAFIKEADFHMFGITE